MNVDKKRIQYQFGRNPKPDLWTQTKSVFLERIEKRKQTKIRLRNRHAWNRKETQTKIISVYPYLILSYILFCFRFLVLFLFPSAFLRLCLCFGSVLRFGFFRSFFCFRPFFSFFIFSGLVHISSFRGVFLLFFPCFHPLRVFVPWFILRFHPFEILRVELLRKYRKEATTRQDRGYISIMKSWEPTHDVR